MNRELIAARESARDEFLRFKAVLGVGIGPKVTRGRIAADQAIVVLVDKKLPSPRVPKGELIPHTYAGFPTDVRVPVLQPSPSKSESKDSTPFSDGDWCLTDYQWIDWTKVHRTNVAQHPELRAGKSREQKPRRRSRGTSDD